MPSNTSHWPEISYKPTPICVESWEMWSVASPNTTTVTKEEGDNGH